MFGRCDSAAGSRSVILMKDANFDGSRSELTFDIGDVSALNVGSTASTVAVLSSLSSAAASQFSYAEASMSKGDQEFIDLTRELLNPAMQEAAAGLLASVRRRASGELKRGLARNFSETPDNFWYVIVQPRVQQLSITVRGPKSQFEGVTHLPVKDDRGNTLFKVVGLEDVEAAVKLIFLAKRKT
jgi:hypothetical protein